MGRRTRRSALVMAGLLLAACGDEAAPAGDTAADSGAASDTDGASAHDAVDGGATADGGGAADGAGADATDAGDAAPAPDAQDASSATDTTDGAQGADATDATDAGAVGGVPPTPISESGKTYESETHLVVAPTGRTLAIWMRIGSAIKNGFALSEDRGATFGPPAILEAAHTLGDPIATAGLDGSFYYGYLDGACGAAGCSQGHVWVARMAPGDDTFGAPVDASPADPDEFYDKPWLMTGSDGALILVTAARKGTYPSNVDRLIAARSADGQSWTYTDIVPPGPPGQVAGIPHACASPTGTRVWALHVDSTSPTWSAIRWSDDLGATWPAENRSTSFALPSEVNGLQSYDLRCVGEGDDVWVEYGVAKGPSSGTSIPPLDRITVAHSGDGGATWDLRTVVNPDGPKALRPEIARDATGALHVIAYTGAEEGDAAGAVRWWRSTDGGETFEDRGALHAPILFTGARDGSDWVGDYSGLVIDGGDLFATFVDNSSGKSHILFTRRPLE